MKKETFKQVLFSAALLASVFEVQAQDNPITFTRDMTFRENYGWANSMCTPKIGDFDNDGVNDLWLDGQRQSYRLGKPVLCLPKDWEKGRSRPTLNL